MNHHISGAGMLTQKGRDPLDHVQDFGTSETVRRRGFGLQMSHYGVTNNIPIPITRVKVVLIDEEVTAAPRAGQACFGEITAGWCSRHHDKCI